MRHGTLLFWLIVLWALLWGLNVESQSHDFRPFQWPDHRLSNPIVAIPHYFPPFVALGLILSGWISEALELVFVVIALAMVLMLMVGVALMAFLVVIVS
jgi:hypothetical protein